MNDDTPFIAVRADLLHPIIGGAQARARMRLNNQTFALLLVGIFPPLGWWGRKGRLTSDVASSQDVVAFMTAALNRIDAIVAEEEAPG